MIKTLVYILPIFISINAYALTLKVVTSDFPPYQIIKDEKVEGLATEVVKRIIDNAGLKAEFRSYPWPRAYKIAQNEPNVLIYSIVRIKEREKLFKWIGSIATFDVCFWKLSDRSDIKIKKLEDAKKYLVGGVNSDIKAAYLIRNGFEVGKNLTLVNSDELNLKMLVAKRIDLLPADESSFLYRLKLSDLTTKKFAKLINIDGIPSELYIAASLTTSDEIVNKLRNSMNDFYKTKKYKIIQKKYKSF